MCSDGQLPGDALRDHGIRVISLLSSACLFRLFEVQIVPTHSPFGMADINTRHDLSLGRTPYIHSSPTVVDGIPSWTARIYKRVLHSNIEVDVAPRATPLTKHNRCNRQRFLKLNCCYSLFLRVRWSQWKQRGRELDGLFPSHSLGQPFGALLGAPGPRVVDCHRRIAADKHDHRKKRLAG